MTYSQLIDYFTTTVRLKVKTNMHTLPQNFCWLFSRPRLGAIRFLLNLGFNFNHFSNPINREAALYKLRERQIKLPKGRNSLIKKLTKIIT